MSKKGAQSQAQATSVSNGWKLALVLIVVLNGALASVLWTGDNGLARYRRLQAKKQALHTRLEAVRAENRRLSRQIRLLQNNDRYLAYTLRANGLYVHSDEIVYVFPAQESEPEDTHGQ